LSQNDDPHGKKKERPRMGLKKASNLIDECDHLRKVVLYSKESFKSKKRRESARAALQGRDEVLAWREGGSLSKKKKKGKKNKRVDNPRKC